MKRAMLEEENNEQYGEKPDGDETVFVWGAKLHDAGLTPELSRAAKRVRLE